MRSANELTEYALDLAVRLRDGTDPDAAAAVLLAELRTVPAAEVRHLVVAAAALVEVEQPRSQVLAWCDGVPPQPSRPKSGGGGAARRKGCPSEAAYRRHLRNREPCPTGLCRPYMASIERERRARHPEWGVR